MPDPTHHDIIHAMSTYGGSFAQALAAAYQKADPANQHRLRDAFPDLWNEYRDLAQLHKEQK